jgi:hypothetical protein
VLDVFSLPWHQELCVFKIVVDENASHGILVCRILVLSFLFVLGILLQVLVRYSSCVVRSPLIHKASFILELHGAGMHALQQLVANADTILLRSHSHAIPFLWSGLQ